MELILQLVFKLSLIIFMVGNLLTMGLQLELHATMRSLHNKRFVLATLLASFVLSPVLAYLLTVIVPMQKPYATGLLLLGFAPSAPFLPMVVRRARGDMASAAALMLMAALGTVLVMPLALPLIASGMRTGAWTIARPLLLLVLVPLMIGILTRHSSPQWASRIYVYSKTITGLGTLTFLIVILILYFKSFLGAFGSGAFLAQILFVSALAAGGYLIASALEMDKRSVVSLGVCTRNIGAAAAVVGTSGDQRITVMLVIGMLATLAVSFGAAAIFGRKPKIYVVAAGAGKNVVSKDLQVH